MKKKHYLSPTMEVSNLTAHQMLCASTEQLTTSDFDWGEDGGSSTEKLNGVDFNW
ncbi:MAG: hypothetical protein Q4A08_08995 [Bacteroidales bacterium]|nr:hypothetical protein [Bacteroidales bacterium]